jgi:hypothetical protein
MIFKVLRTLNIITSDIRFQHMNVEHTVCQTIVPRVPNYEPKGTQLLKMSLTTVL